MPLGSLLLYACVVALVILIAVLTSTRVRREIVQIQKVTAVLLLSLLMSGASAVISSQGASGTGMRTLYGYPKPFFFIWESWEQPISQKGFSLLYFTGNTLAYATTFAFLLLVYVLARQRTGRDRTQV